MLKSDKALEREVVLDKERIAKAEEAVDEGTGTDETVERLDGKLMVDEEMAEGRVSLHACRRVLWLSPTPS